MKRIIAIGLIFLMSVQPAWAEEKKPQVAAQGAVLIDGSSGRVLWGKDEDKPLAMASTTKIMTAILILEDCNLSDKVVIGENPPKAPKVNMNLRKGECLLVKDLLYGLLLKSYNDSAVALAEHHSGSVEKFCDQMTQRAKKIGAKDTCFSSPNGLDGMFTLEEHHSTAYDMALLGRYALKVPHFQEICQSSSKQILRGNKGDTPFSVQNSNRFLRSYEGALGMKTGYTNKAGNCFVGAAKRDDVTLLTTVLASGWGARGREQKWKDTKALMDYGFSQFEKRKVISKGKFVDKVAVTRSPKEKVSVGFSEAGEYLLSENELEQVKVEIYWKEGKEAPVFIGEEMGIAKVMLGETCLDKIPLLAQEEARPYTLSEWMKKLMGEWTCFSNDKEIF